MTVSQIVQETRKSLDMTLEDFAAELNVTKQAVNHWERGKRVPDIAFLVITAAVFSDWRRTWAQNCLAAIRPEVFAPAEQVSE